MPGLVVTVTVVSLPEKLGKPCLAAGVEARDFGAYGIVAAPGGGVHLHLEPDEFALLGLVDGTRPVAQLVEAGGPATTELLDDLWEGGFLEGAPMPTPRRVEVTAQGIEFLGANRVVRYVYRHLGRFAFTPAGVVAIVALSLAGLAAFATQAASGRTLVLTGVAPVLALVWLRALSLSDTALHEMGHAMVIARHDRRVGRIGIGFYWGMLSFYVDATDALFLDRRSRMLNAAAGCITDLVLCGIASLAALALSGGRAQQLLLEFAALAYISVLMQAVPLLELDGYWFLADALDRPSLHHDSTNALHKFLRREPADRALVAYATLSSLFGVASLVGGIAIWWHLFGHLFHQLWAGGVVYKLLAAYLLLPFIALAFQLSNRVLSRTRHSKNH
jgi:putative peptide zinc metalloprotease protein